MKNNKTFRDLQVERLISEFHNNEINNFDNSHTESLLKFTKEVKFKDFDIEVIDKDGNWIKRKDNIKSVWTTLHNGKYYLFVKDWSDEKAKCFKDLNLEKTKEIEF